MGEPGFYGSGAYIPQFHHCFWQIETDRLLLANKRLYNDLEQQRYRFQQLYSQWNQAVRTMSHQQRKRSRDNQTRSASVNNSCTNGCSSTVPPSASAPENISSGVTSAAALPSAAALILTPTTETQLKAIFSNLKKLSDLLALRPFASNPKFMRNEKFSRLMRTLDAVQAIEELVGLQSLKAKVLEMISYYAQFAGKTAPLMHIVIEGPPGVGKSRFGRLLAKLMCALGVLPTNKVVEATRSKLIAGYLGQTAIQTQELIDKAMGGVLFIDEAYGLGESTHRDSFSKECLDTLTENLMKHKGKFLCIVAGYEEELESCFFAANPGLARRFPVAARMKIEAYTADELFEILLSLLSSSEQWRLQDSSMSRVRELFHQHHKQFRFFAGDVETVLDQAKLFAAKRLLRTNLSFNASPELIYDDILQAYEVAIVSREEKRAFDHTTIYN